MKVVALCQQDCVSVRHVPAAMVAIALAVPAGAAVKPGDVITAQSAYKVKDLVSPGVYYKVCVANY